jgi:hypothetical protein
MGRSVRGFLCGALVIGCLAAVPAVAEFPARPLRLYIGTGAGGGADAIARYYAEKLTVLAGQPVTVENKPGAGGNIASAAVARAPADGYHILFSTSNSLTGNFYLDKNARTPETRAFCDAWVRIPFPGQPTSWRGSNAITREMATNREPSRPRAALTKGVAANPPLSKSPNCSSILAIY